MFFHFFVFFCEISLEKNENDRKRRANDRSGEPFSLSVHDLPGHTKMKFRQQGQAAPGELEKREI